MLLRNVYNYQTTRRHIPENTNLNGSRYENVISCVIFCLGLWLRLKNEEIRSFLASLCEPVSIVTK